MKKYFAFCLLSLAVLLSFAPFTVSAASYESNVGLTLTGEQPTEPPKSEMPSTVPKEKPKSSTEQDRVYSGKAFSGKEASSVKQSGVLPHTGDTSDRWNIVGGVLLLGGIVSYLLCTRRNKPLHRKLTSLLLVSICLTVFLPESLVFSASWNQTTNSKADMFYTKNAGETKPVDPDHPSEEVEPDSIPPANPGTKGPLSIDFASNIQFGSHEITGQTENYFAALTPVKVLASGISKKVPNYVQVTDNRGTLGGYRLTVKQNGQLRSDQAVLEGAEMVLLNSTLKSATSRKTPQSFQKIVLDATGENASDVIVAKAGTGAGTWVNTFGTDTEQARKSIQVILPKETKKQAGHYRTTLTWEMIDSPY
ncbi:WxL domain-containing protein [Listeria aquatica]|uniref:WxL domain-containing protein n=1 Tax=Listeria aquatica TaxID=1494960 RepID=UPI0031F51BEC